MNLYKIVEDHKERMIVKDLEFAKTHKFKTEEELFDWMKRLKSVEEQSILQNRWDLGTVIIRFYDKEYGKDKLQKISDEVGYPQLRKIIDLPQIISIVRNSGAMCIKSSNKYMIQI